MARVRLVGIARGRARVLVQRTVVADDQGAFGRIDVLDPFEIELDDGRRLRVEPTKDARIEPSRDEKAKWGDIESDPAFASIRERGPGPHVVVEIQRRAVCDGDRVALDGEEKDFSFEDEAKSTMRNAPTKTLASVTAEVLASGPNAEKLVADLVDGPLRAPSTPKKKREKRERRRKPARAYVRPPLILLVAGIALVVTASRMAVSPLQLDVGCVGIALVAVAAHVSYVTRLPRFVHGGKPVEDAVSAPIGLTIIGGVASATLLLVPFIGDSKGPPANGSSMTIAVLSAWLVGLVYVLLRWTKRTSELVAAIASAKTFTRDFAEHTWGAANGVVRDPTPITHGGEAHAVAQVVDVRVQAGSDPNIVVEKVINHGTFFVDTEDDSFELHPSDATWASSVRRIVEETSERKKWADVVPLDGSVVVVGRASRPTKDAGHRVARFEKGRGDSLLFYATPGRHDAHARIRSIARARLFTFAVLLASVAAMIAWGTAVRSELPAFHVEGGEG